MTSTVGSILGTILLVERVENMFGKTHEVVFVMVDEVPTTMVATSKTMTAGAIAHITSHLTTDTVVIGAGRTIGAAALGYGLMALTNYKLTGKLRFNPLSAE